MSDVKFDPSKRRLCPDGGCIGVIGDDGRCRVCGRASDGSAAPRPAAVAGDPMGADNEEDDAWPAPQNDGEDDAVGAPEPTVAAGEAGGDQFQPGRRLCDDGSCVGVIGANGRCAVCGRAEGG
jgi:hypothetical protein